MKSLRVVIIAGLIASAIVLHIFKIPYLPIPFLKFDLSGVPLVVAAFISLFETTVFGLPVFFIGVFALGGATDPIGPAMKVLAELFTYLPMVITYRRLARKQNLIGLKSLIILIVVAVIGRISTMCIANLLVTPYWLLMARWVESWEKAWNTTLFLLPHIAIFNAIAAVYVAILSVSLIRIIKAIGVVVVGEKGIRG